MRYVYVQNLYRELSWPLKGLGPASLLAAIFVSDFPASTQIKL